MGSSANSVVTANAAANKTKEPKAKKLGVAKKAAKSSPSHPPFINMITDAIVALKERTGSSQYAITKFIEENHRQLPSNFRKNLLVQLKKFVASGKLVKVKASYKLAPTLKKAAETTPEPKTKVAVKLKAKAAAAADAKPKAVAKPKATAKATKIVKTVVTKSPGKKVAAAAAAAANPKKSAAKTVKKPKAKSVKSPVKKAQPRKTKK